MHPGADMEYCNHKECEIKRLQWLHHTRNVEYHGDKLRNLLAEYKGQEIWSSHADLRESERKITSKQSKEALDNGDCIWFIMFNDPIHGLTFKWLWLGYAKVSKGTYRPIHLVIMANVGVQAQNPKIVIGTVYDPSEKQWMWDETYSTRIYWEKH